MQDTHRFISGIQQVGIGVRDAHQALHHYKQIFSMETLVFDDTSEASLMTRYTGGSVYQRRAMLSLNMQGGGGMEIWQFNNRKPSSPAAPVQYGDIGICAVRIKCQDPAKAQAYLQTVPEAQVSELQTDQQGTSFFWVKDQYDNLFQVISGNHWFWKRNRLTGGISGAVIGVSDMDKALAFYRRLLQPDVIAYDYTTTLKNPFSEQTSSYRKVLLQKDPSDKGAFGKLFGSVELELVQCLDRVPQRIFADRFWGDCGFIHLCLDVYDICGLKEHLEKEGYCFTVDSLDSFDMEQAAGRFGYVEDPDGTLIEMVETHKVPILKKLGWFLDLKKRGLQKPLPDWMIRMLSLNKVK
jgi:catechol 2,3-dioxygenase-like lactoylglutathione lyase family enzyme